VPTPDGGTDTREKQLTTKRTLLFLIACSRSRSGGRSRCGVLNPAMSVDGSRTLVVFMLDKNAESTGSEVD
jgi:hypothetical protein